MMVKKIRELLFNVYTIPALLITVMNILVLLTGSVTFTWYIIVMNIFFWITGIMLKNGDNLYSIISIAILWVSLKESVASVNNIIDPYFIHFILIVYFITCDIIVFINKDVKKIYKIILYVVCGLLFIFSMVSGLIDYNRVKNDQIPLFMIMIDDTNDYEYIGLGYRMTLNKEPVTDLENIDVNFGSWFYLFEVKSPFIEDYTYPVGIVEDNNSLLKSYYVNDEYIVYGVGTGDIYSYINGKESISYYLSNNSIVDFEGSLDGYNIIKEEYRLYEMGDTRVLFCDSDGVKDVYIGTSELSYKESYCQKRNIITGRLLVVNEDQYMLISDEGPIMLSNNNYEDIFYEYGNGDNVEVIYDGINESYPMQMGVYGINLISDGTLKDVDQDMIDELIDLGFKIVE